MKASLRHRKSTALARVLRPLCVAAAMAVQGTALFAAPQFSYLDPAYQQEIYTGPVVGGPGMAWTPGGNLLSRNGSSLIEYSPIVNATHLGTNIHAALATHVIAGMNSGSTYGMVNGLDGYIYTTTGTGLQRINPSNWTVTTPGVDLPGSGVPSGQAWGISVLPNGKIVYVAGPSTNLVYVYDPVAQTAATLIYTSPSLIDDIQASPTGEIALAEVESNRIRIISATGTVLTIVDSATANNTAGMRYPDGLAFGYGTAIFKLFSNDNQGSITEYDFGTGYSTLLSSTTIASGGSYGDLAAVGPDCALYVSQYYNNLGPPRGSTFGTNWVNGTNNEASFVRISKRDGTCGFSHPVSEPAGALMAMSALALMAVFRRRVTGPVLRRKPV